MAKTVARADTGPSRDGHAGGDPANADHADPFSAHADCAGTDCAGTDCASADCVGAVCVGADCAASSHLEGTDGCAYADHHAGDAGRADEGDRPIDPRTLSQTRADLALDLLLTGTPGGHDTPDGLLSVITASISVAVPVTTLMGEDGPEAELDGRCPIDPTTARALAGAATGWDRVLTHPITGGVLAVDRYRPSEALKRHLIGRDQRCRFPGCGMPAWHSDLDHTKDAAFGGATDDDNFAALCRRHHVLKHHSPWLVRQLGNGLLEWTSPTRRIYIDKPPAPNTVTFSDGTELDGTDFDAAGSGGALPGGPSGAPDGANAGRRTVEPWAFAPEALLAPF